MFVPIKKDVKVSLKKLAKKKALGIAKNYLQKMHKTGYGLLLLLLVNNVFSQKEIIKNWHLLDAAQDGYHGISWQKAMDHIKNKTPKTIIVAVLDGGVDTNHVALKNCLWLNKNELPGNGKDDDRNGYLDDIHGWNFLGNVNGKNLNHDSQESVRIYHLWKKKFNIKNFDIFTIDKQTKLDYDNWLAAKKELDIKEKEIPNIQFFQIVLRSNRVFDSINRVGMNAQEYTADELIKFGPTTTNGKKAKLSFLHMIDQLDIDHDETNRQIFNDFESLITKEKELANGKKDSVENYRALITGDDENDLTAKHYGNADVMGETALHGTHVSGIIAAKYSDTGTCGIAPFAKILSVRCVPDGDEHDKDIALAVFYAVDNGAKVINMSFGKATSPHKAWVDSAFKYAAAHDVLLVHAAGNDSKNIDGYEEYPKPEMLDNTFIPNMITVGASGDSSLNCGMLADFTNYGEKAVDVLAPGVKIYSTLPNNMYGFEQGTSMAAPVVSGIAALIRGYFPRLTAVQTKQIIEESVDKSMTNQNFKKPGAERKEKIKMKDICKTGGIVNAYNAVLLAEKLYALLPPLPIIIMKTQLQNSVNLFPKAKGKVVNR